MTATAVETSTTIVQTLDVTTSHAALLPALKVIAAAIQQRPVIPVFAGVVVEGKGDHIELQAFDYEVAVRYRVEGAGTGRALIPARPLLDFIKDMSKTSTIDLSVEGKKAVIDGDGFRYRVETLPIDDYPALPAPSPHGVAKLTADMLARVGEVTCAAGRDDALPVLTAVRFEGDDSQTLTVAATDRYRLCVYDTGATVNRKIGCLVPARLVAFVVKHFAKSEVFMSVSDVDPGFVTFTDGDRSVTGRLQDGEFPKYKALMPDSERITTTITFDAAAATKKVNGVAKAGSRSAPVRLDVTGIGVTVASGGTYDECDASSELAADVDGDGMSVAFNPAYLVDGIAAVKAKRVALQLTQPVKPGVLLDPEHPEFRYLLMPVRLAG